ncbi:P-loop containing nucleoside triphosphate hydrolase protein [Mycena pura]|uniref:P-loop containing nucleoside triphosphate hydrolase protein n=1 Tax=Mycena pura TaxID=153505 RepID=A0AAD7E601_9AGAR|nr:P-loop containing nucleoside triphosphate hydrolase protein [Mycena pura]
MNIISSMLSPLGMSTGPLQDTLKLVVIGGTVETARRVSVSVWSGFVESFFLTAHFSEEDYPYDWLMHWLSKQPAWGRSREFEITTRSANRGMTQATGELEEEEEDDDEMLVHGRRRRTVAFMPSVDTTHTIYYITRTKRYPDYGGAELKISVVARNNDILKKLVLEARKEYEKDAEHRVHIFMADTTYSCWRWNGARQKRPMSSIVLQPGVKDMLLADCKDFLCSEEWYAERGIPFRRGYLLHGVPGSGKTSLIHSLAGELGLDIYVVSLSSKGMSDNTLTTLMGHVPTRCILLLEDLDAAFTRSVSRDATSTGAPTSTTSSTTKDDKAAESDGSTLSLSGLLNSLDGVAAAEGRLLFATTNHIERLDPALSRPGRMDVWVNFANATKWQAEGIFKCFFPSAEKASADKAAEEAKAIIQAALPTDASQKNIPLPRRKTSKHVVPLLSEAEISELAKRFGAAIPEDELSVAALQGYLLKNKTRPRECVDEVDEWVIQERETREKLKKEKAEREAKEKKEAEEKAQKEKEEKEAKEKEEQETKEKLEQKEARLKAKKEKAEAEALKRDSSVSADTPTSATESTTDTSAAPSTDEPSSNSSDDSTSSSSSESETTSGAEADTESVTSEEESDKVEDSKDGTVKKEGWVAIKSQTPSAPTPAPAADAETPSETTVATMTTTTADAPAPAS